MIGIEMVESACKDAEHNVKENNMEGKYSVVFGKVEQHIDELVKTRLSTNEGKIIGIVDPPRCGLHG